MSFLSVFRFLKSSTMTAPTIMMATIIAIAAYIMYVPVLSGSVSGVGVVGGIYSVAVKDVSAQDP